jgi:chromosome segregation ATPase
MNAELTPEQKLQLDSWAGLRDVALAEISIARVEGEKLTKTNKDLVVSITKIQEEINQSLGRLDEMTKKEEEFDKLMRIDNAELSARQVGLQSQIYELEKEINILLSNKKVLTDTIDTLVDVHDKVFSRVSDLDKNIEEARRISSENLTETNNLLIALKGEFKKIIDVNAENVEKTNVVINQLPRIIFDLQKDIFERKQFNRHKVTPQ